MADPGAGSTSVWPRPDPVRASDATVARLRS
jgi:hypothetical protein